MSDIRYWTVSPESTKAIAERLLAAGDGAQLRIFPTKDSLTFRVLAKGASPEAGLPDLNEAFPCPPLC